MQTLAQFFTPLSQCGYLPDQRWQLEYELVVEMSGHEYAERMHAGWRRFGHSLFRPQCPECSRCQSLRVPTATYRPSRSQRRNWAKNWGEVHLQIGRPRVSQERLRLYDRFHHHQTEQRGWPLHAPKDPESYVGSFVDNPFPIEEWCYYIDDRLVGVGYVDVLPIGLSGIYFFHEPAERQCGLGVFNVMCLLKQAAERGLPAVYLGYFVKGCPSLEYKADFRPNEVRHADGQWRSFRAAPSS